MGRTPGQGKFVGGRPHGSKALTIKDEQMSFRCWNGMKQAVKKAAEAQGFRGYGALLLHILEEWMKDSEQSHELDPEKAGGNLGDERQA
jgi:hypothetical protein